MKVHLQVKSTYRYQILNGSILFRLKLEKFEELIDDSVDPQYLVVFLMPRQRLRWVGHRKHSAVLRRTAHYLRMAAIKPFKTTQKYAWVLVPLANRLSAGELINMYRDSWHQRRRVP